MFAYFTLGIAILAEVMATSALKMSEEFTRIIPSAVAIVGYIIAFYSLSLTLEFMSLGIAYAIWSGIGIVLLALVDWKFYGQHLHFAELLGMALIIAGVLVIELYPVLAGHRN
jgi:small multidrug resistance pump